MKPQQAAPSADAPWVTLVGLSEAGWAGLGEDARAAVLTAELLVGGQRHLDHVPAVAGQQRLVWPSPIQAGIEAILARAGRPVCVLASGDPFWFGIGATLCRHLPAHALRSLPGPSAFSLAAARMGWPLQDVQCVSVVARDINRLRLAFAPGRRLLILSEDGDSPAAIARLLVSCGFGASRLVALEALGGQAEGRVEATAQEWGDTRVHKLNTLAVECVPHLPSAGLSRVPGRAEENFCHDGQISKCEIRALILAHLAPRGGEHLWDVGAGSGAVSVEWLLADPANRATAVEVYQERLNNVAANARAFGVSNITCVAGRAPQALEGLDRPHAIFIGGGISDPELLEQCWQALLPGGRLVATVVTLEGEAALLRARDTLGGQLIRVSVERAEPLGGFTGWRPARTVTLWHTQRSSDQ
jgi:precorrin-6Y C5,15-methyltransferase (decarboxylating)